MVYIYFLKIDNIFFKKILFLLDGINLVPREDFKKAVSNARFYCLRFWGRFWNDFLRRIGHFDMRKPVDYERDNACPNLSCKKQKFIPVF